MLNRTLTIAAVVAAATIGEGVFALPYIIKESGWVLTLCYFIALIAAVSVAHIVYVRTLMVVDEKERLLGLAKKYFGNAGFWIGFIAIVIGLLLGFVAYLVLGTQFLKILFPGIPPTAAFAIFWFFLAYLVWRSEGKIASFEVAGVALISGAILFIFFSGNTGVAFANIPFVVPHNFFLPFGVVLFSLAGWTSVEQVYELARDRDTGRKKTLRGMFGIFVAGTAFAALLYWLFAVGVIGTTTQVTVDTISGLGGWPTWRKDILAMVGFFAAAVVSLPLAREMRGAMEKDLGWNSIVSRVLIIGLPFVAIFSGLNNFLIIVSLAGGVFLSTQYLLIISVGRRALALSAREKGLLDVIMIIFVCAAVYSVYAFIVR